MVYKFKKPKRRCLNDKSGKKTEAQIKIVEKPKRPVQDSLLIATEDATVLFSTKAISKLMFLVMACEKEVGWHGNGKKLGKGKYLIDDIFLYPQEVTSATIEPDDKEYAEWQIKMCMEDEETFESLCLHGHSHVNMSTFSSGTDKSLQNDIIEMIQPGDFYIFMIINKNFSVYYKIADREDGVIYETSSIKNKPTVLMDTVDGDFSKLVKSYNELVREVTYKYKHNNYGSECYYYGNSRYEKQNNNRKQLTPEELRKELSYGDWWDEMYGY